MDVVLLGTGSPIPNPGPFLRAYLSHRRMRETQIARALERAAPPAAVGIKPRCGQDC